MVRISFTQYRSSLVDRVCKSRECHPEGALATEGPASDVPQRMRQNLGVYRVVRVLPPALVFPSRRQILPSLRLPQNDTLVVLH